MSALELEKSLGDVGQHLAGVSAAITAGDTDALMLASTALRQAAGELLTVWQSLASNQIKNPAVKFRVKEMAANLGAQREGLIRRTALVEMALKAVLPTSQIATYGQSTGPYASVPKQSRVFQYLSA